MPLAMGFRVMSRKGELLCDYTGITWLRDLCEMSDEAIRARIADC
jgi:hypothetical protein